MPQGDPGISTWAANKQVFEAVDEETSKVSGRGASTTSTLVSFTWSKQSMHVKMRTQLMYGNTADLGYTFPRPWLNANHDPDKNITSQPHTAMGLPLLIRDFNDDIYDYIKHLCQPGALVNSTIVLLAAEGIKTHKNPSLLVWYNRSLLHNKLSLIHWVIANSNTNTAKRLRFEDRIFRRFRELTFIRGIISRQKLCFLAPPLHLHTISAKYFSQNQSFPLTREI